METVFSVRFAGDPKPTNWYSAELMPYAVNLLFGAVICIFVAHYYERYVVHRKRFFD